MTFHKYPKIKILGDEENKELLSNPEDDIVIQEKIDGANARFMIKDGRIIFGSRTQSIGDSEQEIGGNWKRWTEYVKGKIKELDYLKPLEGVIYYGEACLKHTLTYDWEKIPPFLGFDIRDLDNNKFIDYKIAKKRFERMGLTFVPIIKECKAKDIKEFSDNEVSISVYAPRSNPQQQAEGAVFKNYDKQVFAKYVRQQFKEDNRKAFGEGKKFAENDSEMVVASFCTNARIDKCVFKLIDEDNELSMELMHKLPRMVLEDIMEEHWKDICLSNWSVNFRTIKKRVGVRCLEVLKQIIVNNRLNNDG